MVCFFSVYCLLKKYLNFVYIKCRKEMIFFFITFALTVTCYVYTHIRQLILIPRDGITYDRIEQMVQFLFQLNIPQLLIASIIVFIKDSSDQIVNVSKLDNLLIISIFQRQTSEKRQSFTPSITTHDNDESRDQLLIEHNNQLIDSLVRDSMMERTQN